MRLPSRNVILLNAGAAMIMVVATITMVRTILVPEETRPCSDRFDTGTAFRVERQPGVLLSGADIQGSVGYGEWGVQENLSVVKVATPAGTPALRVRIAQGTSGHPRKQTRRGGVGFEWRPRVLPAAATHACLTYSVKLPEDFEFGQLGTLPGLFGMPAEGAPKPKSETGTGGRFATRYVWRDSGAAEVNTRLAGQIETMGDAIERGKIRLPRGEWVRLEQEVVLNTPGQADGVLRVWVDGSLIADRRNMAFREDEATSIAGVTVDVHFGGQGPGGSAPKDTFVLLTPFEVRWR